MDRTRSQALLRSTLAAALLSGSAEAADGRQGCPIQYQELEYSLRDPILTEPNPKLSSVLAVDAILALQSAAFEPELQQTNGVISLGAPLKVEFKAGTRIGFRAVGGTPAPCVFWGLEAFEPPVDDEGRPFPLVCLKDNDGDGAHETLRLFAYKAQPGKGIVEGKIKPVTLSPHDRPVSEKAFTAAYRRLRVQSVDGEQAVIVPEVGFTAASPYGPQEPVYRAGGDPAYISLREGITVVAGVPLQFAYVGDSWIATPAGQSQPWIGLECNRSRITILPAKR